jgi:hopanoid biosynthesis associated protein HpnK
VRRLIINADDFGLTAGVNRAIMEAHHAGVGTSATMMANAPATADAARLAQDLGRMSVGCHVVLIDGRPVSPPSSVPSLVTDNGDFRTAWLSFAHAAITGRIRPEEVAAETQAQIDALRALGIQPSHLDTHKHTHLFPSVLKPLLQAARRCGVTAVRNPLAPLRPIAYSQLLRRPRLWKRYTQVRLLRRVAAGFRHAVEAEGLRTTDGTFGIVVTGALDERLFAAIVGSIPEGTWELVCHPGYCDEDLRNAETRLRESRDRELRVLTSPAARDILQKSGVQLISYREL